MDHARSIRSTSRIGCEGSSGTRSVLISLAPSDVAISRSQTGMCTVTWAGWPGASSFAARERGDRRGPVATSSVAGTHLVRTGDARHRPLAECGQRRQRRLFSLGSEGRCSEVGYTGLLTIFVPGDGRSTVNAETGGGIGDCLEWDGAPLPPALRIKRRGVYWGRVSPTPSVCLRAVLVPCSRVSIERLLPGRPGGQ